MAHILCRGTLQRIGVYAGLGLVHRHAATLLTRVPGFSYDGYSAHVHAYTHADVVSFPYAHFHTNASSDLYAMNYLRLLLPVTLIILSGCAPISGHVSTAQLILSSSTPSATSAFVTDCLL